MVNDNNDLDLDISDILPDESSNKCDVSDIIQVDGIADISDIQQMDGVDTMSPSVSCSTTVSPSDTPNDLEDLSTGCSVPNPARAGLQLQ